MLRRISKLVASVLLGLVSATVPALAQDDDAVKLAPNQTLGFGKDTLVRFTYAQNFSCIHQPLDDRNYNGVAAQSDPAEFQTPICQVGVQSTIDPTGIPIGQSEPLYVLVPFFDTSAHPDPNEAFSPALGSTLISLFGMVPEAFKTHPNVAVQCPDPGSVAGTCTMHASRVDLYPLLVALGKLPASPKANVFLPTPNHSHLINDDVLNIKAIWWQVIPVLVTDEADWPDAAGDRGITSAAKLAAAETAGHALQAPSNFFLFFDSKVAHHH